MDPQLRLQRAQALANDELLTEAFDTLRTELLDRWQNSASNEVEARESIWLGLQLLTRVRRHIHSIIETGEMAKLREKGSPFI
tara:strand:+ start:181 stop:429 length:249 start_codon:yes stop_codon:yes gene_type:complete